MNMLSVQKVISYLGCLGLAYLCTACSGDNSTAVPQTQLESDLASIQVNIFGQKCAVSGCHVPGGTGPMPLRNANESFANLVSVISTQKPNLSRVKPNDASNSYLVQKIEGASDIVGGRMPLGRSPLSSDEIKAIREWIDNGAIRPSNGGY